MTAPILYFTEVRGVEDLETDETLVLEAAIAGVNYNGSTPDFTWSVFPSGAGTFSSTAVRKPVFTPAQDLTGAITAQISVTVTIYGNGDSSDLSATGSDTSDSFTISPHYAVATVPTEGPTIEASDGGTFKDGTGISLSITQSGQVADEITYSWIRSGDIQGNFSNLNTPTTTFIPVLTGLTPGIQGNINCFISYRGTGTNALNGSEALTTATRRITYKPILTAPTISASINFPQVLRWTPVQLNVTALGGFYDRLTYTWTISPPGAGSLDNISIANPVFTPDTTLSEDTDVVLSVRVTPQTDDPDRIASNNSLVPPEAEVNLRILTDDRFDEVLDGHWEEAPEPGIQTSIDPATMPLIAEWRPGSDRWQALPGDWGERTAGDQNTVPQPSFIGTEIRDLYLDNIPTWSR